MSSSPIEVWTTANPRWNCHISGHLIGYVELIWHNSFKVVTHEDESLGVCGTLDTAKAKLSRWHEQQAAIDAANMRRN